MNFKCVLFDFDGTLADTEEINFDIFQILSKKYKMQNITKEELNNIKDLSAMQLITYLKVKKYKIPFILKRGKKLLSAKIKEVDICKQNFKSVLQTLKEAKVKIAIITTNSKTNVEEFLKKHNIDCFDFVISASLFGKESIIKKVIKNNNLDPKDVLYVGDEIRDINAAKKSGIKIASVSWGYNTVDSLLSYNPDYLIKDPSNLIDICI
ncbi:HAD-IA family hydrolase [Sedimentibacter sp. zth1]|uniref:HAD-IA family hydrolase n=1 Tax=Sedimentibacter sp. zth1 TaxID=2816908 RepID=UPI001A914D93|nr:HAD-IA family hydrolase [Sedimentibacter sp. zth1]QSX05089.1 HAD-IA family hydrolase [Sedimentibacter sp. zth1]